MVVKFFLSTGTDSVLQKLSIYTRPCTKFISLLHGLKTDFLISDELELLEV